MESAPITVRLLTPEDFAVFRSLRLEALTLEPQAFASSLADWERMTDADWRARLEAVDVLAAFQGPEPLGIMGLDRERGSRTRHRGILIMVYVRGHFRGRGIGDRLVEAVVDRARERGLRQVELAASAENPAAIALYRRHGFKHVGLMPAGMLHEGREIDEVIMVRRLVNQD
ncbi:GNAT family N-acetyltransferase [Xaviernesmea oryzae]|uniref:GNAT family N-acetyltransferase n=1 Tax=Xaviernesmea oryzae TaxID=464029 RepID=A0A1Q9AXM6_9HYPH|nr:GNAT family N-acetyltransferase [Xaviernesmea oryzae]OLP60186.1 GNAT family N-acetyltransferase [Xaviernesmea oryzae]SEK29677.1 Acetyltransferase (GNAT) family protein [Xaviernesmea oryzae]